MAEAGIAMYLHCAKCMDELPPGVSPREFARTQTGITSDVRLRVWCTRHDILVAELGLDSRSTERMKNARCAGAHAHA